MNLAYRTKNSRWSRFVTIPAAIAAASVVSMGTTVAKAGAGVSQWTVRPSRPAVVPTTAVCPGSTTVPVTVLAPAWTNGRGPLVAKQVGTSRICRVCPVTGVTTLAWPNGRGPATASQSVKPGAAHTCTAMCLGAAR